jgi:hypothetical protein
MPGKQRQPCAIDVMMMFDVGARNTAMIYMSPDPYFEAFKQPIDIQKFNTGKHPTMGLSLYEASGRLYLATMSPSTPAAKIPDWRAQIRSAWLIKVNKCLVTTVEEVQNAFAEFAFERDLQSYTFICASRDTAALIPQRSPDCLVSPIFPIYTRPAQ